MTLVVSLRIPDGVVLAADSLQTSIGRLMPGFPKNYKFKTKSGVEINSDDLKLPPIPIPTSTSSFAQKLFPFRGKFGIATFGLGIINGRTVYNHIRNLEEIEHQKADTVTEVATLIRSYFDKEVRTQLASVKDQPQPPPGQLIVGFHVAGYDSNSIFGKTAEVTIVHGNEIKGNREWNDIGCTVSGDTQFAGKVFELQSARPVNYASFSLQDAVDYAQFLINSTSQYQRFADMIPTVGGEVDVALITNYSRFTWIKCKDLTRIIDKRENQ